MRAWIVYDMSGHWLDQVFFTPDCDAQYVRRCLVEHDGFPPSITVLLGK